MDIFNPNQPPNELTLRKYGTCMYLINNMMETLQSLLDNDQCDSIEEHDLVQRIVTQLENSMLSYTEWDTETQTAPSQWQMNNALQNINNFMVDYLKKATAQLDSVGITMVCADGNSISTKLALVLISTK
jgi:hypothetical protein